MISFAILGALGKMGEEIGCLSYSKSKAPHKLALTIDSKDNVENSSMVENGSVRLLHIHDSIERIPIKSLTALQSEDLKPIHAIIDFSIKHATLELLNRTDLPNIPLIIGTTGFNQEELEVIHEASKTRTILLSSNMSLGMNVLFHLVEEASRLLNRNNFDPEIVEAHHKFKQDAPSGTSVSLEKIILDQYNWSPSELKHGREGMIGERNQKELGSFALRGGDVVGDHTVYFFGNGERLELKHQAHKRSIFAQGALQLLPFIISKGPGLYTMKDFLKSI